MCEANQESTGMPCLYKGLEPFCEDDAEIFFGRNEDRDRLVYSLQSSRITTVYGAKQVGKTSLLRAGVIHQLRQTCEKRKTSSLPESVVVLFDDWSADDVMEKLCLAIEQELKRLGANPPAFADIQGQGFVERCQEWNKCLRDNDGEFFILLDQFEQYLLFHPTPSKEPGSFDIEFSRAVTTRGLRVNFLIAIREDLLASLDRYRGAIVKLYDSLIRLEALSKRQALGAIQNPVYDVYNAMHPDNKFGIEADLVQSVLKSTNLGRGMDLPGISGTDAAPEPRYDAAGLQLVMKSLWECEESHKCQTLRHKTFSELLGGLAGITDHYVSQRIQSLSPREKNLGAKIFDHLITPGGMSLAYPLRDLAENVGGTGEELNTLMEKLVREKILIASARGDNVTSLCYEIAHRILTPAIFQKVRYYFDLKAREEKRLGSELENALRQFYEKSQLDGLQTIIDAAEAWSRENRNLLVSDELKGDFEKALQKILDNLTQKAQLGGYRGAVSSVAFIWGGKGIVSGSEIGSVRIWNLASPEQDPLIYDGRHSTWIWAMRVSADGKWLATGSDDGTAALWAVTDQGVDYCCEVKLPPLATGTSRLVRGLCFSPSGKHLAIASTDGQVRIWPLDKLLEAHQSGAWDELDEKKFLVDFQACDQAVRCVEFSPDGLLLATGGDDGTVRLWDAQGNCRSPKEVTLQHEAAVWNLRFHPDGGRLASCSADHTIKLWELSGGYPAQTLIGHSCWVLSLGFNADGSLLASASEDGTARLWDKDGNEVASFIHGAPAHAVCFSPDGLDLATAAADCRVRLWNVKRRGDSRHPKQYRHPGKAIVMDVSFSSDGKYLATGTSDNEVQIWNKNGTLVRSLAGHKSWVMCVIFHPKDPSLLATSSVDGTARVWNVVDGSSVEVKSHDGPVWSVAFSPDGNFFATGSGDGVIRLWSLHEPKALPEVAFSSDHGPVWSTRFSVNGEWVAAGCQDGSIQIRDLLGGEVMQLADDHGGHEGQVLSLSFCVDGKYLASSSSEGRICIWDLAKQALDRSISLGAPIWSVSFSPDGKTLASGSVDRSVCLWDLKLEKLCAFSAQGPIRGLSFRRPEGAWLAGACSDGTVRFWPIGEEGFESLLKRANDKWKAALPLIYPAPA